MLEYPYCHQMMTLAHPTTHKRVLRKIEFSKFFTIFYPQTRFVHARDHSKYGRNVFWDERGGVHLFEVPCLKFSFKIGGGDVSIISADRLLVQPKYMRLTAVPLRCTLDEFCCPPGVPPLKW